jgi:hypothetical protein
MNRENSETRVLEERLIDISKLQPDLFLAMYNPVLLTQKGERLPETLDFEWCKPVLESLANKKIQVDKISVKERERWQKRKPELQALMPKIPDDVVEDFLISGLYDQGEAERARIIYTDMNTEIDCTPIVHGDYDSVRRPIIDEVIKKDRTALLDIHTHPTESSFSFQDFILPLTSVQSMLVRDFPNLERNRLFYALMVLTPTSQIVTFMTEQSPLLSSEEAEEFIFARDKELREELGSVPSQLGFDDNELDRLFFVAVDKNADDFTRFMRTTRQDIATGKMTMLDRSEKLRQFVKTMGDEGRLAEGMGAQFTALKSQIMNSHQMKLLRDINTKNYMSTNMMDFHAFSA